LHSEKNRIFVSIASYRDPQLVPTIDDCIKKASHPQQLRFGICLQRDAEEAQFPFVDDPRFQVLEVDWRESKGACWARAEIMKLWHGEEWFLQLDSHCRLASGWDETLLRLMEALPSPKPILSTYATPFTPGGDEVLRGGPLKIAFQGFTSEGIPQLKPVGLTDHRELDRPMRARFLSGGFLFTPGHFVEAVPYDPGLYFLGEESTMTVRAFTHGYDLFHPSETIVWHDYVRSYAKRHWDDHVESSDQRRHWSELDEKSKQKVQCILTGEKVDLFGLGTVRTLEEYEAYAGLSFRRRRAQEYTVRAEEPPNPNVSPDWADRIYPWIAKITIQRAQLPEKSLDDPALWYVGVCDNLGTEVFRRDITAAELSPLRGSQAEIVLICEFPSGTIPASWVVWPVSSSKGWLEKIEGKLLAADFAILKEEDDEADGESFPE
jgi:hypothetical protein